MKKHIISVCVVSVALFIMYFSGWLVAGWHWIYAELAPGGFRVIYYNGIDFDEKITRRSERRALRDYGEGAPATGVPSQDYSAKWKGWLMVPESADYVFFMQSQGGTRLWIDDNLIIDKWSDHNWMPGMIGRAMLEKGEARVVIEHYKRTGPGAVLVRWAGGEVPGNSVMGVPYVRKDKKD